MRKIIFLDIDGVIATQETQVDGMWGLTGDKQDKLGLILKETGAELVLSSSWRKGTLEETVQYMDMMGFRFCDKLVGVTIRGYHHIEKGFPMSIPRGVEIKQWIDQNIHREDGKGPFVRKKLGEDYTYLILDDDSDMLLEQKDFFVRTDHYQGLTDADVTKSIEILNKKL